MLDPIRVFIGWDRTEVVAWHVLAHSIQERASEPVAISPVMLNQLTPYFRRGEHALASTEFSFSRFLVPFLAGYEGWALFMDCDMLCRRDIAELWAQRDERYAVQVVKHDHEPQNTVKFNDRIQTRYAKKNWSSVMLLNCARCRALTADYVNSASGLELHQFKWLDNDEEIGALPPVWNHLVGYDAYTEDAALVHYTEGGPYFNTYRDCDYAGEWFATRDRMLTAVDLSSQAQAAG